jgi:tetratricopeptide (TPR) repeat protein
MLQPAPKPSVGPPPPPRTVQANTGPADPVVDTKTAESVDAALDRARTLQADGDTAQAHRIVAAILEEQPTNPSALVLESSIYIEEKRMDEALASAEASVEADAGFADAHLALGVIRQERKEYADAVAAYERYLELAPQGVYVHSVKKQLSRLQAKVDETSKAG